MKIFLLKTFAVAGLSLAAVSTGAAQDTVSTGMVESVSPKNGTVTMRSDQTHGPLELYGLKQANIFTADGRALHLGDLEQGQRVTVAYGLRNRHWYITKVILSEPRPAINDRNISPEATQRIRQATEGSTRTPSAAGQPDLPPPPGTSLPSGTSYSVPLRRTSP